MLSIILGIFMIVLSGSAIGISICACVERLSMWQPYGITGIIIGSAFLTIAVLILFKAINELKHEWIAEGREA